MNRILALVILCFSGILIGSCGSGSQSGEESTSTELSGRIYRGLLPCADCQGILYEISLKANQQYRTSSIYIGESNRPFSESGSWEIKHDTLLVLQEKASDKSRRFEIGDSSLMMLDQKGNRVTGSLADHYMLDLQDGSSEKNSKKWADLREQGIDFRAAGNEPFWGLKIDFDKQISFKTLNGDSIQVPVPDMEQDTASKARTLKAETESGALKAALYPIGCMDDMSGEIFTHSVVVEYKETTYRGCGSYINDPYKLHDFWTLHALAGSKIGNPDSLRKVPALQFDLKNGKVFGNNGCNQLTGGVTVDGNQLTFGQMVSTKMACPGNMESRFMDALQQVNSYAISQGELMLLAESDTLMVFHRAE